MENIREGYKMTEIGVIPEDWDIVRMGDIGEAIIGLTYSPEDIATSGILVHRSSNIQENRLSYEDNVYVSKSVNKKLVLEENDILICVRNGSRDLIGKSALIRGKSVGETFGAFMSVFRSNAFQPFIYFLIISDLVQAQINQSLGATINQITNKTLNSFCIPYPKYQEQTAIATTLSDIDSLISSYERLIDKKKKIKQGTMQELLTGKKRLKGFSGEWKTMKLGEVVYINKGQQLNKSKLTDDDQFPVINGGIEPSGYTNDWNTEKDTITISEGGNSCGFVNLINSRFWAGGHCYVLSLNGSNFEVNYTYQVLKNLEPSIMSLRVGSGLPNIQKSNLGKLQIFCPLSKDEQTAIAQVLSDLDLEITNMESKLSKLKLIKQGAMQQLLTGKIRLKF